jgi:hypothetical protein
MVPVLVPVAISTPKLLEALRDTAAPVMVRPPVPRIRSPAVAVSKIVVERDQYPAVPVAGPAPEIVPVTAKLPPMFVL